MKKILIIIFLGATSIFTKAQNVDFYGKDVVKDICDQYGMKDDEEAKSCMDKICEAADIPNNFVMVPCPNIDNCFALNKNRILYIVYDIQFFNKIKTFETFGFTSKNLPKGNAGEVGKPDAKAIDWAALTILAHELGHHMCQHTTNVLISSKYTPVEIELQADEYAGKIMYKLGASLQQAQMAMNGPQVPLEASFTHPGRDARLAAIAKGWNEVYKKDVDKKLAVLPNSGDGGTGDDVKHNPHKPDSDPPVLAAIAPSIIVIPYTKEGEDIRTKMDSDEDLPVAITKIKEAFDNRKFNTVDFVAKLKQAQVQNVFKDQNITSIKSKLIEFSGVDVYVEVQLSKYSSTGNGTNKARLLLQAYDASSARSLANIECVSNPNRSTDWGGLVSNALSIEQGDSSIPCRDVFLNTLQASLDRMMVEGQPITMQIGFAQGSKYNADYAIGDKQLSDVIDDWLGENAKAFNNSGVTTTTINYSEIRIPYRDAVTGKPYRINTFQLKLINYLKTLGITATKDIKDRIAYITIK